VSRDSHMGNLSPASRSSRLPDLRSRLRTSCPSSLRIHYVDPTCGDYDVASASTKAPKLQDSDGNGVPELETCFTGDALATLVPCLTPGAHDLQLEVWGSLANGDLVRGAISHSFQHTGPGFGGDLAQPAKNRVGGGVHDDPGGVRESPDLRRSREVDRDVHGRAVRDRRVPSNLTPWGARPQGGALPRGVYFIRVATEHDGSETRAVTVVR